MFGYERERVTCETLALVVSFLFHDVCRSEMPLGQIHELNIDKVLLCSRILTDPVTPCREISAGYRPEANVSR